MSIGIVSIPPASTPCSDDESCELLVHADGWFSAIDLHAFRATMRVGTAVTDARLREAVLKAMVTTLRDVSAWRSEQVLCGIEHVSLVPGPELDAGSWYENRWRTAVYNYACAELAETHRDVTATGDGSDRAEDKALSADDYRRDALHAVRDILGVTRIVAELI
ncbi:MAG: head completion/stabilization protein [Pseudomonadota bacterium]